MIRTYRVIAIDNQSLPPLEVKAASGRVAAERAAKAIVQWYCAHKGLPFYNAAYEEAWSETTATAFGPSEKRTFLGGYKALRYLIRGDRDDPEGKGPYGHYVPCGGVWRLEEVW